MLCVSYCLFKELNVVVTRYVANYKYVHARIQKVLSVSVTSFV